MSTDALIYRENFSRAVFLKGEINDDLARSVTWEFLRLSSESDLPITVLIESQGGSISAADDLSRLFRSANQAGIKPKTVAVVHNFAASAAAHILATSPYSIAYPGCIIHMHGSRLFGTEVTKEEAVALANRLSATNAKRALLLAQRVFGRIMFRYAFMKDSATDAHQQNPMKPITEHFVDLICEQLSGPSQEIAREAHKDGNTTRRLVTSVASAVPEAFSNPVDARQREGVVLKAIIDHKLMEKSSGWTLREGGVHEVVEDFLNFWDYLIGEHNKVFKPFVRSYASLVVDDDKVLELSKLTENGADISEDWCSQHVIPTLDPLWYFTVCLTRRLQRDENPLSATDAYWLGLVDEVVGRNLPTMRMVFEGQKSA